MALTKADLFESTKIGEGNYGKVYKTYNINPNYPDILAIKYIKFDSLRKDDVDPEDEINILKEINCAYITRFYTSIRLQNELLHVFEYMAGGDLFSKIQKEPIRQSDARNYLNSVKYALMYIHNNLIMHRDIKPENVLLDENNNAKLTDFGYAKKFEKGVKYNHMLGSIYYISPEMIKQSYDYRIDIWMIGVLYYETLLGYPPFENSTKEGIYTKIINGEYSYPDHVPKRVREEIDFILRVDPDDRPALSEIIF